jgi:multicomponent Na+:H+ antiporter subunit C
MLTAIVVGVATLGVALALAQKIYQQHSSFDEDEILENERK